MHGNFGKRHTEETKARFRVIFKGRIPWNKGKKMKDIPGYIHSVLGKHWKLSEESKQHIRDGALRKPPVTEITREKLRRSHLGVPYPNRRGAKCHLWKGGCTLINKIIRSSIEYKNWRRDVFERDNYTCVWCKKRSGKGCLVILNADHIKPFGLILKENNIKTMEDALLCKELWDINNGRTLCNKCHKETDTYLFKFNKKNETKK